MPNNERWTYCRHTSVNSILLYTISKRNASLNLDYSSIEPPMIQTYIHYPDECEATNSYCMVTVIPFLNQVTIHLKYDTEEYKQVSPTLTRRRCMYPVSAVFTAVSTRPSLPPIVWKKNSVGVRPLQKLFCTKPRADGSLAVREIGRFVLGLDFYSTPIQVWLYGAEHERTLWSHISIRYETFKPTGLMELRIETKNVTPTGIMELHQIQV